MFLYNLILLTLHWEVDLRVLKSHKFIWKDQQAEQRVSQEMVLIISYNINQSMLNAHFCNLMFKYIA